MTTAVRRRLKVAGVVVGLAALAVPGVAFAHPELIADDGGGSKIDGLLAKSDERQRVIGRIRLK